jgi:hypothetical protein
MKNLFKFLGYSSVILVAMLGAYIVFHMWNLTETGRKKANTAHSSSEPGSTPMNSWRPHRLQSDVIQEFGQFHTLGSVLSKILKRKKIEDATLVSPESKELRAGTRLARAERAGKALLLRVLKGKSSETETRLNPKRPLLCPLL